MEGEKEISNVKRECMGTEKQRQNVLLCLRAMFRRKAKFRGLEASSIGEVKIDLGFQKSFLIRNSKLFASHRGGVSH